MFGAPEEFKFETYIAWFLFKWALVVPAIAVVLFMMIVLIKHRIEIINSVHVPLSVEVVALSIYIIIAMGIYFISIVKHVAEYDVLSSI